MPQNTPTAHIINCGFAHTAIFQLFSKPKPSKSKDKTTHQSEKSSCTKDTTQDGLGELQKYNSQCEGPEEDLGTTELGGCTTSFGDKQAKTDEGGCATTVVDKTDLNEHKQDPVECFQINFGSVYNLTTSQFQLYTNTQISKMSREDIITLVSKVAPCAIPEFESKNLQGMQMLMRVCQRNRALWMWSDHSVLLDYGLVLIVVGAVYDPLVYLTDNELPKSHKATMTVQEMVDQGEVYIMAHCSSSSADQAGLIPERVACLDNLSDPIVVEEGLTVHDSLKFFKGDKQSAWFEAGIQRGVLLLYCM